MEQAGRKLLRMLRTLILVCPLLCESTALVVNWDAPASPLAASVGDSIEFAWNNSHDVHELANASTFAACDFGGAMVFATASPYIWNATNVGTFYFGCSISDHCATGIKLQVNVNLLTSTPTTPSPNTDTPTPTTPPISTPTPTTPSPSSTSSPTAPPSTMIPTPEPTTTTSPTPTPTPTPTTNSPTSIPTQLPTGGPTMDPTNVPTQAPSPITQAPTIACDITQCQSIRRQNCSTMNMCGDCSGGYTGSLGPSNTRDCVAVIDCSAVNCTIIGRTSASGMCAVGYVPSADFQTCTKSSSSSSLSTRTIIIIAAAGGGGILLLLLLVSCYCCRTSKPHVRATSWTQPDPLTALDVALSDNLQGNPLTAALPSLPAGWEEQRTDNGEIYYWHPATERSVWERHEIPNDPATERPVWDRDEIPNE